MAADRNLPAPPSERSFGILFAVVFAGAACWLAWHGHRGWAVAGLAAAVAVALLAFLAPRALAAPNRAWFQLGMLLHKVVSPVVLGAIYFLVITPIALAMRLSGRDPLERRRDPQRASYWKDRDPPGPPPDSFRNQF
jgi:hypothetical protein